MSRKQWAKIFLFSAAFASSADPVPVVSSHPFSVTANPIIRWQKGHFSADPAVEVIHGYTTPDISVPRDLVLLLTSTDLTDISGSGDWPMNGSWLSWTFGGFSLKGTWYDYDAVPLLQESDFTWVKPGSNHMFAPDIQFVEGVDNANFLYFFVPDLDNDGKSRIGVAHANTTPGNILFDHPTTSPSFFQISGNPPNGGYAFDPGVFHALDTLKDANGIPLRDSYGNLQIKEGYFMVYADGPYAQHRNASMVKINKPDMNSGDYLGKIGFTNYNSYNSCLDRYWEGPDVHVLTTPSGNKHYYLLFEAQVLPGSDDPGYIAYAMATPDEFWASPTSCWKFKGWLFNNIKSGRNNQVSLAQHYGQYYAFFHRMYPEFNNTVGKAVSRSRQVCLKEIELIDHPQAADDGEIMGVTIPANQNQTQFFGAFDGLTKSVDKNFFNVKDSMYADTTMAMIRLSSFKNASRDVISRFSLYYYLNIEQGCNLLVEPRKMNSFTLGAPYLRHVNRRTWAVVFDYNTNASDLIVGDSLRNWGELFTLRYDPLTSPAMSKGIIKFDKSNDYSQPLGNYNTWSSRIAVRDRWGSLLEGEAPDIAAPVYIKTSVADGNGKITYLTASTAKPDDGINNQYQGIGARNQWIMEDASDFTGVHEEDKPNALRLKNASTSCYMTCNDLNKGSTSQPFYYLLDQAARPSWNTMVWVKEDAGNGLVRFRNLWRDQKNFPNNAPTLYLTRHNGAVSGTQQVYVRPQDANYTELQKWSVAEIPTSKYIRTSLADADGKYTYATVKDSVVNSAINSQYLNTGWTSQEWIFEDASDFTSLPNAVRIKSQWTGHYMTCNDINKGTDQTRPYYLLLSQQLNKEWNTQIWLKEDQGYGIYMLRTMWTEDDPKVQYHSSLYVDCNIGTGTRGTQPLYVKPGNANASSQQWRIE